MHLPCHEGISSFYGANSELRLNPRADTLSSKTLQRFSMVELLVVVGIIALLIALLLPALANARAQAKCVVCQSNLRQIGVKLLIYANNWNGWIYPPKMVATNLEEARWPISVFKPAVWNPAILICPADFEPALCSRRTSAAYLRDPTRADPEQSP